MDDVSQLTVCLRLEIHSRDVPVVLGGHIVFQTHPYSASSDVFLSLQFGMLGLFAFSLVDTGLVAQGLMFEVAAEVFAVGPVCDF